MERVDPGGVPPPAEPAYGVVRARPSVGGTPVIAAQLVNPPTPMPLKLDPEPEPEPEPEPPVMLANEAAQPGRGMLPEDGYSTTALGTAEPDAAAGAAQANQAARVAQLAQQQDGAHGPRPSADELVEDTSWQSQVKAHELVEQDHRAREQLGRSN